MNVTSKIFSFVEIKYLIDDIRCHGFQRIPHPMWRYQHGPSAFSSDTWACHIRCGSFTHWRVASTVCFKHTEIWINTALRILVSSIGHRQNTCAGMSWKLGTQGRVAGTNQGTATCGACGRKTAVNCRWFCHRQRHQERTTASCYVLCFLRSRDLFDGVVIIASWFA